MHAVAAPKAAKRWLPEWISDLLEKGLDVSVHETSEGRRKDLARGVHTGHGVDAAPRDLDEKPDGGTLGTETTPLSGKNTWSSELSASIRTCPRWQRMCSSSGISCLRLEDGRWSKSRLRGQFDGALVMACSRNSRAPYAI